MLVAALAAAIGLSAVAASFAAPPIREIEIVDDTDPDFCGTGAAIETHLNMHLTYANPDTGDAVVERWSVTRTNEIVSGLESGPHTHEFVENGLKASYRLVNGGLLTRDAGSLTYRVSFDENDDVTDFEAITIHGPHPNFTSEGDPFCDTLVPALGLS